MIPSTAILKSGSSLARLRRIFADPAKYAVRARKMLLQRCSPLFARSSFRLESQMDIHHSSLWHEPAFVGRYGGYLIPGDPVRRRVMDLEPWDTVRRDMLVLLLREMLERQVPGAIAELGVYQGRTARLFHYYAPERALHLYDTFGGFHQRDIERERAVTGHRDSTGHFADTSVEGVLHYIKPLNGNVHIHAGFFPESVPADVDPHRYSFVHLDADLYAPTLAGLEYFYPRLERGGILVVHDYNAWAGAREAVRRFFTGRPEIPLPMPDKSGSIVIVKQP